MTHEMISVLQHVAVQSHNQLPCAHLDQVKQPNGGSWKPVLQEGNCRPPRCSPVHTCLLCCKIISGRLIQICDYYTTATYMLVRVYSSCVFHDPCLAKSCQNPGIENFQKKRPNLFQTVQSIFIAPLFVLALGLKLLQPQFTV